MNLEQWLIKGKWMATYINAHIYPWLRFPVCEEGEPIARFSRQTRARCTQNVSPCSRGVLLFQCHLLVHELDLVPLESCLLLVKLRLSFDWASGSPPALNRTEVFSATVVLIAPLTSGSSSYCPQRGDTLPAVELWWPLRTSSLTSLLSTMSRFWERINFLIASSRYCSKHLKNAWSCGPFHFISLSKFSLAFLCL